MARMGGKADVAFAEFDGDVWEPVEGAFFEFDAELSGDMTGEEGFAIDAEVVRGDGGEAPVVDAVDLPTGGDGGAPENAGVFGVAGA